MKFTTEERKTHNEALVKIFNKYHSDASFKNELLNTPEAALKNLGASYSVEAGKTLVFEDQTDPNAIYFNIPSIPNIDESELTEEQLEVVAGGGSPKYEANLKISTKEIGVGFKVSW